MDVDHPELDQHWDAVARSETEAERLDRNWSSLLQELRVTQTGVQLLTGFLLTLPFQARFAYAGLLLLGAALTGVAVVVFGTVLGATAGVWAGVLTGVAMLTAWVAYPVWMRR